MKHSLSFCVLPFINNRGENSFSLNFSCLCFPFLVVCSCLSFSIKVVAHSFQLIHNGAQELKTFSLVPPFYSCNTAWYDELNVFSPLPPTISCTINNSQIKQHESHQSLSTTTLMTGRKLKGKTDLHCSFDACAALHTEKIYLFHQLKKPDWC